MVQVIYDFFKNISCKSKSSKSNKLIIIVIKKNKNSCNWKFIFIKIIVLNYGDLDTFKCQNKIL